MATTRTQARASLKRWLGNRTDLTDADYDLYANDALFDLTTRRVHLQSLEKVGSTIAATLGQHNYPAPTGSFAILHLEDTTNKRTLDRYPGGFEEFLRAKQNQTQSANNPPTQFIEYGNEFWVGPAPPGAVILWIPYYYSRAVWAAEASAVPGVEEEWHHAVLLLARVHAAQELGELGAQLVE